MKEYQSSVNISTSNSVPVLNPQLLFFVQPTFHLLLIIIDKRVHISKFVYQIADYYSRYADWHKEQTLLFVPLAQLCYFLLWFDYHADEDRDKGHWYGLEEAHAGVGHTFIDCDVPRISAGTDSPTAGKLTE